MDNIKVIDVMEHSPVIISPEKTVMDAARLMKEADCGSLLIGTHIENIVGIITDRDITLRLTAEGKDASQTLLSEVMTKELQICDGHTSVEDAAQQMCEHNIRRLIVITKDRATGIVNITQLLHKQGNARIRDKVFHSFMGIQSKYHAKAV